MKNEPIIDNVKVDKSDLQDMTLDEYMTLMFGDKKSNMDFENGDDAENVIVLEEN